MLMRLRIGLSAVFAAMLLLAGTGLHAGSTAARMAPDAASPALVEQLRFWESEGVAALCAVPEYAACAELSLAACVDNLQPHAFKCAANAMDHVVQYVPEQEHQPGQMMLQTIACLNSWHLAQRTQALDEARQCMSQVDFRQSPELSGRWQGGAD